MGSGSQGVEIVRALQSRVEEIIKHIHELPSTSSGTGGVISADHLTEIRNSLQKIEEFYSKLQRWEESKFKSLELHMYDQVLDDLAPGDKVYDKLDLISQKIESINLFISNIHLPDESVRPLHHPTQPQPPQVPVPVRRWMELEEQYLNSHAIDICQPNYGIHEPGLKACLLFFAVFPKNVVIKKKTMIFWWIGEGIITKSKDKTAEEVGEGILEKFIKGGILQPCSKTLKNPIVDCCTVNPWIRRVLISEARREKAFDIDKTGKIEDGFTKSHRACLFMGREGFSGIGTGKEYGLQTLFNINEQYLIFMPEFFLKFKKLKVVQLGMWQKNSAKHHIEVENEEFLEGLHALEYLTYLSLHGLSRITRLPSSLVQCRMLEIIDLRACHNLEKLPSDIGSLKRLTHLDVSDCFLLETMPKGIENLCFLQVLKGFVIGKSRKNACKLSDLARLKKLRKLSMHIRSEAVVEEGELEKLEDFGSLCILTISWGVETLPPNAHSNELLPPLAKTSTTMESLLVPANLEKLDIRSFPCNLSPKWLNASSLKNLNRLYIRGGELESFGTYSEDYWNVKLLRLKYLKNLKVTGSRLVKMFPNLSYFEMVGCNHPSESQNDVEWNRKEGLEELKSRLANTDDQWNEE